MSTEIRTILAQFQENYDAAVRISGIQSDWRRYLASRALENLKATTADVKDFLAPQIDAMLANVAAHRLVNLSNNGISEALARSEFDPESLIREMQGGNPAELSPELISAENLLKALTKLYAIANVATADKGMVAHYLTVLKHGENFIKALLRVVRQFILDADIAPNAFASHADREKLVALATTDLDADAALLLTVRNDLAALETRLSGRVTTLFKLEGSFRMATNQHQQDNSTLGKQSRNRTNVPGGQGAARNFEFE